MKSATLAAALTAALTPIRRKAIADRILTEIEARGCVSEDTIADLLHYREAISSSEQVLLDLAKVLLDHNEAVSSSAHPAVVIHVLGDEYGRAYVDALRIVWES